MTEREYFAADPKRNEFLNQQADMKLSSLLKENFVRPERSHADFVSAQIMARIADGDTPLKELNAANQPNECLSIDGPFYD